MATSTITLPDHIKQLAESHAASHGFSGADEYVQSLILADAAEPIDAALEAHLVRGLEKPGIELSAGDWDEKRRRLAADRSRAQS
jgi:hypothetical protein